MTPMVCEKEQQVLGAVRSGRWDDESNSPLRLHAASCPACADVALVAQFLHQDIDRAGTQARLPEAGLVWWKAQLLARRAAAERATQPIALVERVACAWGLLSLLGVAVWRWPEIGVWVKRVSTRAMEPVVQPSAGGGDRRLAFVLFGLYSVCPMGGRMRPGWENA